MISGAIGMFPNLIVSTTDPAYDLTIYNAAAADNTLMVCLIVALIGIPFVLLYRRRLLHLPGQDRSRLARLLTPAGRPEARLRLARSRADVLAGVALSVGASLLSIAFAALLAIAIAGTAGVVYATASAAPETSAVLAGLVAVLLVRAARVPLVRRWPGGRRYA